MAPAHSRISQPEISRSRKRKASSKITDENFVGAESNTVTKRLKLSAAATKRPQRQASVEDVEDQDNMPRNIPPKKPNTLLEATDGSDEVEELDDDPPPLEIVNPDEDDNDNNDNEEAEITEPIETAKAQLGKSNKML